jgi:hypothetical protein
MLISPVGKSGRGAVGYVDRTLATGERVLHRASLHWVIFVGPVIVALIGFSVLYIGALPTFADPSFRLGARFCGSFLVVIAILREAKSLLDYFTTEVAATTRRFVVKRGWVRRSVIEMNAGQLESIIIDQSILGRIFGYGTIVVAGTGSGIDPVRCVAQPLEVRKAANQIGRGYQHEAELQAPQLPRKSNIAVVIGDGAFAFPVVGESHHQIVLEHLVGGRTSEGAHQRVAALIEPQPDNPYDPGAVAVKIRGEEIGFLARDVAPLFRQALMAGGYDRAACEAVVVGGWERSPKDRGSFGVRLNARLPFKFQSADEWQRGH